MRYREIHSYYTDANGISQIMHEYPDVQFRYLITPTQPLETTELKLLDFSQSNLKPMMELGVKDAEESVAKGAGYYFKKTFETVTSKNSV
jgi:hypothetical protein